MATEPTVICIRRIILMSRAKLLDHDIVKERAFDEAVAKVKANGFRTFCILYEDDAKIHCQSYPETPGIIKGLCDRILHIMQGKFFS